MITLRKPQVSDLNAVHALISNIDVVRYVLLPVCPCEESQKFLSDSIEESPSEPWRSLLRAVIAHAVGEVIGLCGLVSPRGATDGEIRYLVSPTWWGKGIATVSAKASLALGLHRKSSYLYAMLNEAWRQNTSAQLWPAHETPAPGCTA